MTKDETGKCGWNEFCNRFIADPTSQFSFAEKPKTEEELKAEQAPKKIIPVDLKRLQEILYFVLKQWRFETVPDLVRVGRAHSKNDLREVFVKTFAAERAEAQTYERAPESWSVYMSVNDSDLEKLLDGIPFDKKGTCAYDKMIDALEKKIPANRRTKPDPPKLPSGGTRGNGSASTGSASASSSPSDFPIPSRASALPDMELKTVAPDRIREWVADTIFYVLAQGDPWSLLRAGGEKVAMEPLIAYPPLAHWPEDYVKQHAITTLDDPRTERGGLLLFLGTVRVDAVKRLDLPQPQPNGNKSVIVVYAQFLYGCQTKNDELIQWRVRAKLFLGEKEKATHLKTEDSAIWINGDEKLLPATPEFSDWDFPAVPFQFEASS